MLVKYWMTKEVITVAPGDSMKRAMDLIKKHQIHQMPVLKDGKLKGMLSDGDLKRASASDATTLDVHELIYLLDKVKVSDIMSKPAITVPIDYTIEEAAELLLKNKISGMPAVSADGNLQGIITQSDLFRALVSLTGLQDRGLHIAILLEDRPGSIMEVANVVRNSGGKMTSILTSYKRCPPGYRRVYFRVYEIDRGVVSQMLDNIGRIAQLLYVVDHRENRRTIYNE
ncbi:MAG: CBS and ACT domain-containing protein [Desulfobacteraceae bacterium]|nr:CBS and ACT domain-containing protein [Desulfobacteraceae bacterium]